MTKGWLSTLLRFGRRGARGKRIRSGEKYASSLGDFRCGPFDLETTAEEHFGPHGGTLHLKDEVLSTRIDIEGFDPPLEGAELTELRDDLYQNYLSNHLLPLVQSGIPTARLLDAQLDTVSGRAVLRSAILTPGVSPAVSPDGKRIDGIRGQVQFTNGRFMYTVTRVVVAWPSDSAEKQLSNAHASALAAYQLCDFPA